MADLTTLAKVRTHLGIESTDADSVLSGLITSSSAWVLRQLDREVLSEVRTETVDGDGSCRLLLSEWPVQSVTSVTVDGDVVPVRATVGDSGWILRDDGIDLVGYTFTDGQSNVVVVYRGGYEGTTSGTIPTAPGPYTVAADDGWLADSYVTIAGVAATAVTGTPTTGQYSVSAGTYTFAAADAGKAAVLYYGICPTDLEQAVVEHVALRYRDRGREGLASMSAGGESAAFAPMGGTLAYINGVLDSYRRVAAG